LLTTPIELVKTQQQQQQQRLSSQHGAAHVVVVASARQVVRDLFRTGGTRLLYRGFTSTVLRDVGGFGMYFYGVCPFLPSALSLLLNSMQYEATLRAFAPDRRTWPVLLLAGGAAGVLGWVTTFPFDVLKTRMQAHLPLLLREDSNSNNNSNNNNKSGSSSTWRTARAMYAEAGPRVFWRGLAPTLVRAVPVNMAVFGTFEGVVWAFS